MDVIIVCHTEFGFVSGHDLVFDKKVTSGVTQGVLNLAKIADKHGAKISFAVCPEAVPFFPKDTGHAIGLHLHPGWQEFKFKKHTFFVGDKYIRDHCTQSTNSTLLRDFSLQEQSAMIRAGKECIESELRADPKFFVAGRWSLNNDTVRALVEHAFTHDASASSHVQTVYPDWDKLSRLCNPYHPDTNDYQKKGDVPLLVVPVSQYFPRGNVNPEALHRVGLPWLKACFTEYYRQKMPLFHICLHSPSMTDDYFSSRMNSFLSFIAGHDDVHFKFITEISEYPDGAPVGSVVPYLSAVNTTMVRTLISKIGGA